MRSRFLSGFVLVVLLFSGLVTFSCKDDERVQQSGVGPAALDVEVPPDAPTGVPGFAKVSDVLYRGGQPTREGFLELKKLGVRTVINLRSLHSDRELLEGLGFKYLHVSFKPWHMEDEDMVRFLKVVAEEEHQPVFVHCALGVDRTGAMVAVYRMYAEGWAAEEAMAEMEQLGFHNVWENLKRYLRNLDVEAVRELVRAAPEPVIDMVQ